MGHPVRGEIGPRRTAVFIGQVYIYDASLISPRGKHSPFPIYDLRYAYSIKNGYSPRCNLTHNRVTRLVWWRT